MGGKTVNNHAYQKSFWQKIHLDVPLLIGIVILMSFGLFVIYSASGEDPAMMERQLVRMALSLGVMFCFAQINPEILRRWALPIYLAGVALLIGVELFGTINKGAQRWLNLGFMEFQPSELIKLAFPITMAWYISKFPLPPKKRYLAGGVIILLIPTLLIAKQPDLGTSILVAASGVFVLFLSGMSWLIVGGFVTAILIFLPVLWFFLMHDYQRTRVLTLFVIGRGLVIASRAQTSFARLLAGSITLTFFVYVFVNIGMVSGILPVVGVPLPLISYGGTSMLTLMTGFGILMSIHTHRRFVDR